MLERLASTSFRHRRLVIVAWLLLLVAGSVVAGLAGGEFAEDGRLAGTESQAALDLLEAEMPGRAGESTDVVLAADAGLTDPSVRAAVEAYLADVGSVDGVAGVTSPYDRPEQVAPSGTIAFATVDFAAGLEAQELDEVASEVRELAARLEPAGIEADFGGWLYVSDEMPASEAIGLLAAVVILLVAFGSVVAMGLPLVTAIVGIGISIAGVGLVAAFVPTPEFTVGVASMIGIGVGIDYALFIVTRYRAALARGAEPIGATIEAVTTAGRAVVFAGITVMISLLGMLVIGVPFLRGLAIGSSLAVAVAVAAAVTLLPALLGVVGRRIDRLSVHRRRHDPTRETTAHRWARGVQRRPVAAAVAGTGVLLALTAPVLSMRLAGADTGNEPEGTTARAAYDRMAEGFGPGVNGPLAIVIDTAPGGEADPEADRVVADVADAVAATEGVAFTTPPVASPSGRVHVLQAFPTTSPQSEATTDLVHELRDDVLPAATSDGGSTALVGGRTAFDVDFADVLSSRLPWFIGAVLLLSFVLLLVVFRSVLVPVKAVVMNLLSIGAAYGLMVMVFQWGWLGDVVGVSPAPIEPWAPMMLFAVVFGLSMDYEVFLLSSIREQYDRTGDSSAAVVEGLASTARVITAAAAIMVCVFASFVVADSRPLKLMGLGLSAAILVDATIVRMVLVPATMELLGRRNWWLPGWLDRLLPRVDVEGHGAPVPAIPAGTTAPVPVEAGRP